MRLSNIYVLIDDKKRPGNRPEVFYTLKKDYFFRKNQEGWGIYTAVNEFNVTDEQLAAARANNPNIGTTKRQDLFCTKLLYVYADLDIAKAGDRQTREEKQAKKRIVIKALIEKCEPTFIIDTSNGLQPFWELEDGPVTEEIKATYKKIIKGIIEWSRQYGCLADGVFDTARVLRIPGYFHMKEEPYYCWYAHQSERVYDLDLLETVFPFTITPPKTLQPVPRELTPVDKEIKKIPFQELIVRAFTSVGRKAEFDSNGRLVLDGRQTGTFQGRTGDRRFLATSSHEPFHGNEMTAVADILKITWKQAREWIIDQYKINWEDAKKKEIIEKQLAVQPLEKREYKLRYTWGTRQLDTSFGIIKPGNLIVVGAKRGTGKTTYTFDMAVKNANLGHKVLYISLEMSSDEIKEDFARKYAGVTIEEELDYKIPEYKQTSFARRREELGSTPNLFFEGLRRGDNTLWETIVAIIEKYPDINLVFIDNLDRIGADQNENNLDKQKRIIDSIMGFTAEKQVPIVLIHHHRKNTTGKDWGMDELSGSGKIADGADMVMKIIHDPKPDAPYPDKYSTTLLLQKARGYRPAMRTVYFIRGTFVDNPPPDEPGAPKDLREFNPNQFSESDVEKDTGILDT